MLMMGMTLVVSQWCRDAPASSWLRAFARIACCLAFFNLFLRCISESKDSAWAIDDKSYQFYVQVGIVGSMSICQNDSRDQITTKPRHNSPGKHKWQCAQSCELKHPCGRLEGMQPCNGKGLIQSPHYSRKYLLSLELELYFHDGPTVHLQNSALSSPSTAPERPEQNDT